MRHAFLTGLLCLIVGFTSAQNFSQTVRGKITDADSESPLIGATIVVANTDPVIGTITDVDGSFRLEKVPTGRITLHLSYVGYEPKVIPNVLVNSGKEVVLDLDMIESTTKMEEVVITANKNKGEALNEMAIISSRSVSPEETSRYAGGFNDPALIVSNFAGVTSTQDGSNDVIVRGNSPKYVQWRLEGVPITNPNHFADQSAVSGSISTLNNNMLAASDFYTGAFTPEYGNALSGVYDVKLRTGNNEKQETVLGVGLIGTDLTLEGPFSKSYNGSYIVNYRYSTTAVLGEIGVLPDEVTGIPKFQDASFKVVLPTQRFGAFSLFGLAGKSDILFEDLSPSIWETPGDRGMREEITEDYQKGSYLLNTGLNHSINLTRDSYLSTTVAYSREAIDDDVFEHTVLKRYDDNGGFIGDSTVSKHINFKSRLIRSTYQGTVNYHHKLDAKNKLQIGARYAFYDYSFNQSHFIEDPSERVTLVGFDGSISTLNNFISWKHRVNDDITIVSGLHNMNVLYNNKSTLEPRIALNWQLNPKSTLSAGYGNHSTMEAAHNYFTKVEQEDGSLIEPNKGLGLLRAHHYVIGYENRITNNVRAKVEVYYQDLYNLPVENSDTSLYATINEGLEFRYVDLINKGTGKNYGVELTVERFFSNNYYFLVNGSLFESKYTPLDGVERNTQYSSKYLVNLLFGKEFTGLGRKDNQTLGLNAKVFFGGGRKIIPLLRDEQGNLAVNPAEGRFWDYDRAYETSLDDLHMVIVSASYKWNKPRATHELFINLDNITNSRGKIREFYDEDEPDNVGNMSQFGLFPNLMYRVYF